MNRSTSAFWAASLTLSLLVRAPALADTTNAFTSGTEGWFVANVTPEAHISVDPATVAATWDGANGAPAGSLREPDIYLWTFVGAPANRLGNWSDSFGGTIRFDLYIRLTDGTPWPAFALRGKAITLYYVAPPPAALDTWTTMSAPLTGAGWRVNNWQAGPIATDAQMLSVLADVRGIYLLTEWHTGSDDSNLDNFSMTGAPTPVCTGDVNGDGQTNISDFNILAGNFGTSVPANTGGDLTGDGVVNISDFNVLAGNFGCGV